MEEKDVIPDRTLFALISHFLQKEWRRKDVIPDRTLFTFDFLSPTKRMEERMSYRIGPCLLLISYLLQKEWKKGCHTGQDLVCCEISRSRKGMEEHGVSSAYQAIWEWSGISSYRARISIILALFYFRYLL